MDKFKNRNIKQFDGDNYSVWKARVLSLLKEMKVLKVIESEQIEDEVDGEWLDAENTAKNVLIEYLADSFITTYEDLSARQIIEDLDSIYARKSLPMQIATHKQILKLKLTGDTQLKDHFRKFQDLINELTMAGGVIDEMLKIAELLITLPSSYDGVITAIETMSEENLTLSFVKTKLLDHETKLRSECSDTSTKVLQAVNQPQQIQTINNNSQHRRDMRSKQFQRFRKTSGVKCHHCGRPGHLKNKCFYFQRSQQYRNNNYNNKYKNKYHNTQTAQLTNVTPAYYSNNATSNYSTSSFAFMAGDCNNHVTIGGVNFILDSGATNHIINRSDLAENFEVLSTPLKISIAKQNTHILATKCGSLQVKSDTGYEGVLLNVLYCEDIPQNLLSVSRMQEAGYTILFDKNGAKISFDGKIIMNGEFSNNLIFVKFKMNQVNTLAQVYNSVSENYDLWHQRLGHMGRNKFIEMKNKNMVEYLKEIEGIKPNDSLCEACIKGKKSRLPYNTFKNKTNVKRPLYIVHSDVCGPITPPTIDNKNYFVFFVDEYTHYCVTYLITYKSDVFNVFRDFIAKSETRFNTKLVNLYTDNGGEYLSREMKDLLIEKGISYHLTVPRTPQLNGVAERMVRNITEKARAMLAGTSLDKAFWGEAVLTATYLINITPTNALNKSMTPYELWHEKKPKIKYLRIFGATVYMHNKTRKSKFEDKTVKGILVGYVPNAYKVWIVETGQFVIARDVIVDEKDFLKSRPESVEIENTQAKTEVSDKMSKSVDKRKADEEKSVENYNETVVNEMDKNPHKKARKEEEINRTSQHKNEKIEIRRSERIKDKPKVIYNENIPENYIMSAQTVICKIPNTYAEIKESENRVQWEQAVNEEIDSLMLNNTWTLVSRPEN